MNSLNIERLKYISTNMQEVIGDLDEIELMYDSQPDIIKIILGGGNHGYYQIEKEKNYVDICGSFICYSRYWNHR